MKTSQFICFATLLFLMGCDWSLFDKPETPDDPLYLDNPIDWENPLPGQQTLYRGYLSTCDNYDADFTFTNDTLILKVLSKDGELYFAESFTVHSSIFQSGVATNAVVYQVLESDHAITIKDRNLSYLFHFTDTERFLFNADMDRYFTQFGCTIWPDTIIDPMPVFSKTIIGKIPHFKAGDSYFEDLVIYSNYIGEDGFILFKQNTMVVSHFLSENRFVQGWLKLN
ncbi:MAG: hypothetical protein KDD99_00540 [Bacteroidetes bacterium]|nr:hypothetical protein [Bacteroidota bacterium]